MDYEIFSQLLRGYHFLVFLLEPGREVMLTWVVDRNLTMIKNIESASFIESFFEEKLAKRNEDRLGACVILFAPTCWSGLVPPL